MERPLHLFALSAGTLDDLRQLAGRHANALASQPRPALGDVCFSAAVAGTHREHRLALLAATVDELATGLGAVAAGGPAQGAIVGRAAGEPPRIAFLFTGQGAQHAGMGRELYETQPSFRRDLDRCAEVLDRRLERPLLEVLFGEGDAALLDQTAYTQPALFALEYGLARLWQSWGVEPAAVLGHSVGELTAACVAGVFGLEAGLTLIAERGRLMQSAARDGDMVAVFAAEDQVSAAIAGEEAELSIASINGPRLVVVSGRRPAVESAVARLSAAAVRTQKLNVSHAFHSPSMDSILEEFESVAQGLRYAEPSIAVISNVTGRPATPEIASADYWRRHVRQPVRFADGMSSLAESGCEVFVEIGPKPTLLGMGRGCLPEGTGKWLPSLKPGRGDWRQLLESLGALYVMGVPIDWAGHDRDYPRQRVPLPS